MSLSRLIEKRLYPKEYYFGYSRGLSAEEANKFAVIWPTVFFIWFLCLPAAWVASGWVWMLIAHLPWWPAGWGLGMIFGQITMTLVIVAFFSVFVVTPRFKSRLSAVAEEIGLRPIRCIGCDYDLRHIDSESCPECGRRIPGVKVESEAGKEADAEPR